MCLSEPMTSAIAAVFCNRLFELQAALPACHPESKSLPIIGAPKRVAGKHCRVDFVGGNVKTFLSEFSVVGGTILRPFLSPASTSPSK